MVCVCVSHNPLQSFKFQQVSATSRLPKGMQEGFSVCVCVCVCVCVSHNPLQSFEFQQVSATSRLPKGMQEGFSVCVCVCHTTLCKASSSNK